MHVLVTGAGGFVGRRLVHRLKEEEWRVTTLAHDSEPADAGYSTWLRSREFQALRADEDLRLVHLGWDVRNKSDWPSQARCLAHSMALFSTLADRDPRQIIALGTADEYGTASGVLAESDAATSPCNAYGWAKAALREFLASWRPHTTSVAWLRPFLVYGPGQSGSMVVPAAMRAIREKRSAQFTDGEQQRDFVHVNDLVESIMLSLQRVPSGMEVVNIGTGQGVRVKDFLLELERASGVSGLLHIGAIPRRQGEPEVLVANPAHASDVLGWSARTDWREGIRTLL